MAADAGAVAKQVADADVAVGQRVGQVKERDVQLVESLKKGKELLDKSIRSEIAMRSFKDRAERLAAVVEDLSKKNQALLNPGGTGRGIERKPPPEDVEGIVKNSDARSGLATISIGSDAGLLKGHTLEVFRSKPKPFYLGQIKIVEVGPHEAVGKVVYPQYKKLIQANDEVASHIVPR